MNELIKSKHAVSKAINGFTATAALADNNRDIIMNIETHQFNGSFVLSRETAELLKDVLAQILIK